jgi:hypothetical protein
MPQQVPALPARVMQPVTTRSIMTKATTSTDRKGELTKTHAGTPSALKSERGDRPSNPELGDEHDIVAESSEESFPASDAPASYGGKDIAPQDRKPS